MRRVCDDERIVGLRQVDAAVYSETNGNENHGPLSAERQAGGEAELWRTLALRGLDIGFISQSFNLTGDLTVGGIVELPLLYCTGISTTKRKKQTRGRWRK